MTTYDQLRDAIHLDGYEAGLKAANGEIERLRTQLSAAEQKLARIKAVADADAKDLATMRDGTKLTRSGIVEAIAYMQEELAECYRLTGADPDGNEDWRLARSAVSEVRRLRQEFDETEEKLLAAEQQLTSLTTERDELRRACEAAKANMLHYGDVTEKRDQAVIAQIDAALKARGE